MPELRAVQASIVNGTDIFAGSNTDKTERTWRYNGCHLSNEGLDIAADCG